MTTRTHGNPDSRETKSILASIKSFERPQIHKPYLTRANKAELLELQTSTPSNYPGAFPKGFSNIVRKELLLRTGEVPKEDILQPFGGGSSEAKDLGGDTIDINPSTKPTVVGDSSTEIPYKELMKQRHGKKYKLIVLDPPWGASQSKRIYKTKPIGFEHPVYASSKYVEKGGFLVITDTRMHQPPPGFTKEKDIIYDIKQHKSIPRRIQFFRKVK